MLLLLISETVQLALVGSLVPTIAAVGAILIGWWSNRKIAMEATAAAKKNAEELALMGAKQEATSAKADHIIEQGTQIHTLTNSNLSQVTAQLAVANERIKGMEELVKTLGTAKRVADELSTRKVDMATTQSLLPSSDTSVPIPVADEKVAELLKGAVTDKLDDIKAAVDEPPK